MRTFGKALLAATAAVGIAGAGGLAFAASPNVHTVTIQLPDGATAKIQYTGNVAPKVTIGENPIDAGFFAPPVPFDMLDAASARMGQEMNWLLRQAAPIDARRASSADLRNLPRGIMEYSMVSTMTPNGACMRQMEITSTGKGKPKIVSRSSGDCGKASTSGVGEQPFDSAANIGDLQSVNYAPPG